MEYKEVRFNIPKYAEIPDDVTRFTEQENLLMLLIGINTVSIVKKEYVDNDLCKEIEERIARTYQKIIEDRERQNRELNDINTALKKTFEETSIRAMGDYYERMQDGISKETKNISFLYEKQLENQRNELQKYQEKVDLLNKELTHTKLAAEQRISDKINENREHFEQQIAIRLERKEEELRRLTDELNQIKINVGKSLSDATHENRKQIESEIAERLESKEKQIEKQNEDLRLFQERINEMEKTIIKLEDQRIYNEKETSNKMELELSRLLSQKDTENGVIADTYKKTIDELRDRLMQQEINYQSMANDKNVELMDKCKVLQDELIKTVREFTEYKVVVERERNEELGVFLRKNEQLLKESTKTIEDLKKEKNMSNTMRGSIGENYLCDLLKDAFYDFEDFKITDTSKVSHSGDFIMDFKGFSIMVDSKNYSNGVGKKEIKKLADDINANKHIKIAWLVSLHTPINNFSRHPVMYEIQDDVCYCYINSLSKIENPKHLLRTIWYSCSFLFERVLTVDNGEVLLGKYKKNEMRIKNIVEKMMKKSKERLATLMQLKENFEETERDLKEILHDEIISVYDTHKEVVAEWWKKNIRYQENSNLKTKNIYTRFISEENNKQAGISIDSFKNILKGMDDIISAANIVTGGRPKSDFTILNVGFIGSN